MAFRHYGGQPPAQSVIWKCPTCGTENAGRLEDGCPNCKAGADAAKSQAKPSPKAQAAWETVKAFLPPTDAAFDSWVNTQPRMDTADYGIAKRAFEAGAEWARKSTAPAGNGELGLVVGGTVHPEAVPEPGGYCVVITPTDPDHPDWANSPPVDPRTASTILAALAFYRDNQLAYGAVPGQLDAQEVSQLIEKLSPPEVQV